MAYSLRLPAALDALARAKSDYLGISLNSLVCVALDAYLQRPGEPDATASGATFTGPGAVSPSTTTPQEPAQPRPGGLTRAQKQAIYEKEKALRKSLG